MPRRTADWLAPALLVALLVAVLVALITKSLDTMPGLHGDEAWFGLRAAQMAAGESTTIHGMNGYTGAAFPWIVSLVFRVFGPSTLSLRSVGVVANLVSLALLATMCWHVRREPRSVVIFLLLAAGSLFVTAESRVAWEVSALNPVLASGLLILCALWVRRKEGLSQGGLLSACGLLFVLSALGTFSHFIFIVLPAGLFVASLAAAARYRAEAPAQLVIAQAVSLANLGLLAGGKLLAFHRHLTWPGAPWLFSALLLAQALLLSRPLSSPVRLAQGVALIDRGSTLVRVLLWLYFLVGGAAFAGRHLVALIQTMSNDVLAKRLYSVAMPPWLLAISYLYVAAVLGIYAVTLARVARNLVDPGASEYFLLLVPVGVAAALPLVVLSNSIRHYILVAMTLLVGAWVSCARLKGPWGWIVASGLGVYGAVLSAFLWSILGSSRHYSSVVPIRFRVGHNVETSAHFLALGGTFDRTVTDRVEAIHTAEPFFIRQPLEFYALSSRGRPVVPGRVATIDYDYGRTGGIAYRIESPEGE